MRLLNVGSGGSKDLPKIYSGWDQDTLDIDVNANPDIVCDAREMRQSLAPAKYEACFMSHCLEHFYKHEIPAVLAGFQHVLKASGFAHITVPDMTALFHAIVTGNRDINDTWYVSPSGPISFHDVIYGWGRQVSQGNLYYCHRTGFTEKSLAQVLKAAGFARILTACDGGSLHAFAFKTKASKEQLRMLGL